MQILKDEIRSILLSDQKVESFNDISDYQKKSLAIEALDDFDNFDPADILLYRNKTLKTIATKVLNGTMNSDQFVARFFDLLTKGVSEAMSEIIDEERAELAFESIYASPNELKAIRGGI